MKTKPSKAMRALVAAAALALPSVGAWAHGGEDHGGEAAAPPMAAMAPRATAQTGEFELVAELVTGAENKKLLLTIDRFSTNEPVADAQVEVDSGTLNAVATQIAPGVYAIAGDSFRPPGKYPLAVSVQAGESADLLTATLDLSPPAGGVEHSHATSEWAIWSAAGALLLAAGGLVAMRRRHKNRHHRQGSTT